VSGFTSGAAITIGLSQIQYFMGYKIAKSPYIYTTIGNFFKGIHQTDYVTLLLGLTWWFMLWGSRQLAARHKRRAGWLRPCAPLIVCLIGIVLAANWSHFGGCGFVQVRTHAPRSPLCYPPPANAPLWRYGAWPPRPFTCHASLPASYRVSWRGRTVSLHLGAPARPCSRTHSRAHY
jgi:hypothetical protein